MRASLHDRMFFHAEKTWTTNSTVSLYNNPSSRDHAPAADSRFKIKRGQWHGAECGISIVICSDCNHNLFVAILPVGELISFDANLNVVATMAHRARPLKLDHTSEHPPEIRKKIARKYR